jgi:hypothetical protein
MNYWAITVSVVVAFLASAIFYTALAPLRTRFSPAAASGATRPGAAQMLAEILRNLVLALVIGYLVIHLGRAGWAYAVALALLLWIGFPAILLTGSVLYEKVPWQLAVIHAGDWLVKLLLMTTIITVWR